MDIYFRSTTSRNGMKTLNVRTKNFWYFVDLKGHFGSTRNQWVSTNAGRALWRLPDEPYDLLDDTPYLVDRPVIEWDENNEEIIVRDGEGTISLLYAMGVEEIEIDVLKDQVDEIEYLLG